jgi:hypothetical protein
MCGRNCLIKYTPDLFCERSDGLVEFKRHAYQPQQPKDPYVEKKDSKLHASRFWQKPHMAVGAIDDQQF